MKKSKLSKLDMALKEILNGSKGKEKGRRFNEELSDIITLMNRFISLNKKEDLAIVGGIVAFDKDGEIDKKKNVLFAFGEIEGLRVILNELRDRVEDNIDKDGFVDF